jgi:hypothetical protein
MENEVIDARNTVATCVSMLPPKECLAMLSAAE